MKFLGFIPKVLNCFGLKIPRRQKQQQSISLFRDRFNIRVSAQGFIDRDRDRQSKRQNT